MRRPHAVRRAQSVVEVLIAGGVAAAVICMLVSILLTSMRAIARRAPVTSRTERVLLLRAAARAEAGTKPFDDSKNSDASGRARPSCRLRDLYRNAVLGPGAP